MEVCLVVSRGFVRNPHLEKEVESEKLQLLVVPAGEGNPTSPARFQDLHLETGAGDHRTRPLTGSGAGELQPSGSEHQLVAGFSGAGVDLETNTGISIFNRSNKI